MVELFRAGHPHAASRRNRLLHQCKHSTGLGGAGGFACDSDCLRQRVLRPRPLWHAAPPRRLLYLPLLTSAMPAFEPAGAPRTDLERTWRAYVQRIAAADQAALAALYDATNRLIYGMALRILGNPADAEEVTLDIYTQVWRSASNFDRS